MGIFKINFSICFSYNFSSLILEKVRMVSMIASDSDANFNPSLRNFIEIDRESYMDGAIQASENQEFLLVKIFLFYFHCSSYVFFNFRNNIHLPMRVHFKNEDGFDHGALRLDFISLVMDDVAEMLPITHSLYLKSLKAKNMDLPISCRNEVLEGLEGNQEETEVSVLKKRLFAFGVFSGNGISNESR